jgi:hypothetical protein
MYTELVELEELEQMEKLFYLAQTRLFYAISRNWLAWKYQQKT